MTKQNAVTFIVPTPNNVPKVGTVFRFKGAIDNIQNLFLVVSDETIVSEDTVRGDAYYGIGVTCIKFQDLNEPDPVEYRFQFPGSSLNEGKGMQPWTVVTTIGKIKKAVQTTYRMG